MARSTGLAFCLLCGLIGQSTAHFLLNYPPTIGFDDALEATPPCGSFQVDFAKDNVTDFHVGGDALAMTSIHPQATWLFRATLDETAGGNFTDLLPADQQTGLGDYCERDVMVPASFAGSKGVIQVVQDAPDGILYQCAAVNFVAGAAATLPSACVNVTGLSANYTSDPALSSLPASASATSSAPGVGSGLGSTATATAASSTTSASAANVVESYNGLSSLVCFAMIACGTIMASLL